MTLALRYASVNLRVRRARFGQTVVGVALVVGVFCYLLCLAGGLRRALHRSADPRNLIVLAQAATAESNSVLLSSDYQRLIALPQAAQDERRRPLVSAEYVVQTDVTRRNDRHRTRASIAVRGADLAVALRVRPTVKLVAGRWFQPGADELVAGVAAGRQFNEGALGSPVECGDRIFTVVGIFEAGGGAPESELWGHAPNVAAAYRRTAYSSATVRLRSADPADVAAASARVSQAGIALHAIAEPEYFARQAQSAREVEDLALALVVIMGTGAVFAAMNTMYATVAGRRREIATLRAIGFSRGQIIASILTESVLVALAGGLVGCAGCAAFILFDHRTRDLVGTVTFTSVAFVVGISSTSIALSLSVAAAIGLLGGAGPAWAAGRRSVVQALRTT